MELTKPPALSACITQIFFQVTSWISSGSLPLLAFPAACVSWRSCCRVRPCRAWPARERRLQQLRIAPVSIQPQRRISLLQRVFQQPLAVLSFFLCPLHRPQAECSSRLSFLF